MSYLSWYTDLSKHAAYTFNSKKKKKNPVQECYGFTQDSHILPEAGILICTPQIFCFTFLMGKILLFSLEV